MAKVEQEPSQESIVAPLNSNILCYEDCRDILDQSVNLLEMLQCLNMPGGTNSGAQHGVYLTLVNVIESLQQLDEALKTLQSNSANGKSAYSFAEAEQS